MQNLGFFWPFLEKFNNSDLGKNVKKSYQLITLIR